MDLPEGNNPDCTPLPRAPRTPKHDLIPSSAWNSAFLRCTHYPHRLSHSVLRIARHTAPFRGSAIVPTILSFLSRALKMPITLIYEGSPQVGLLLIHCAEGGHRGNAIHRSTWNAHPPKSRCRILHSPGPRPVSVLDSTPCV